MHSKHKEDIFCVSKLCITVMSFFWLEMYFFCRWMLMSFFWTWGSALQPLSGKTFFSLVLKSCAGVKTIQIRLGKLITRIIWWSNLDSQLLLGSGSFCALGFGTLGDSGEGAGAGASFATLICSFLSSLFFSSFVCCSWAIFCRSIPDPPAFVVFRADFLPFWASLSAELEKNNYINNTI